MGVQIVINQGAYVTGLWGRMPVLSDDDMRRIMMKNVSHSAINLEKSGTCADFCEQ